MRLHARKFQITRLHQAPREGRQPRLQLLPRSMHGVTKAAHVLGPRLLLALSLHRCTATVWPCSFPRRYGPLALCTLPLEHFHQDLRLEVSISFVDCDRWVTYTPTLARIKLIVAASGRVDTEGLTSKPSSGASRLGSAFLLPSVTSTTQKTRRDLRQCQLSR